jgi:acetyl esterase/lipase
MFNGDLENIILCGDSIGGSLALLVNKALYKDIFIKGIILLYPVITFKKHYSSYRKYGKDYFLDTKTMDWFERMYTNSKKDLNYNFDLESLTQNKSFIYLAISEYDVLRDEAIEFKNHLESINAYIKCRIFESMPHNFALMAGKIKGAKQALDTICYDLQKII